MTTKIRIAVHTLQLVRDGKRIKVKPGTQVELTEQELADIKAMNPDAVRTPRNESENAPKANVPTSDKKKQGNSDEGL